MSAKLRHLKRGFTLVELMIVVAIVGILAALAVYGVSRYVKNAKTAEARDALGRMGKDAVGAFSRETMASSVMGLGDTEAVVHQLCASASAVPGTAPASAKYQSKPSDWLGNWACLRFSMNEPQYFQYEYQSAGGDADGTTFTCIARGDLDGDAKADSQSVFRMHGKIDDDEGKKVALLAPTIEEDVKE